MESFRVKNPEFEARVRESFAQQSVMNLIGANLGRVGPGLIVIELPYRGDLTQQNGFIHAGILTTVADSACGYAAFTLMPANAGVLSVEFKVNLLRPARGERFIAEARVIKAGEILTVVTCDVTAITNLETKLVATMTATIIRR